MEVNFDYTREDYWQFNKYAYFHKLYSPKQWIRSAVMLLVGTAAISTVLKSNPLVIAVAEVTLFVGFYALMYGATKRTAMKLPSGKPGFLGEHSVAIGPDGIHDRTPVGDDFRTWQGMFNIVCDKNYIYVFTDRVAGISIPKRAFSYESEMQQFFDTAMGYWKNATVAGATE